MWVGAYIYFFACDSSILDRNCVTDLVGLCRFDYGGAFFHFANLMPMIVPCSYSSGIRVSRPTRITFLESTIFSSKQFLQCFQDRTSL